MKKLSIINENIFDGIGKRSKGGIVRKEDNTNISELKQIDLGKDFPVYFADKDFISAGNDVFTWSDAENIMSKLNNSGWRLPKYDEIIDMFFKSTFRHILKDNIEQSFKPNEYVSITNKDTGVSITFYIDNNFGNGYWCDWSNDDKTNNRTSGPNAREFFAGDSFGDGIYISTNNENKEKELKIRLVKDK